MAKRPDVERGPWMIRSFPVADREKYVAHAQAQDETTAEWVQRACEERYQRENNAVIIAPADGKRDEKHDGNQPEMDARHAVNVPIDMAGAAALVHALLAADGQGKAVKGAFRETIATIRMGMREARGMTRKGGAVSEFMPAITGPLIDNS